MIVVEIKKGFRNGNSKHLMVLNCLATDEELIEDIVAEWCADDPSGQSNGYSWSWNIVTDKDQITKAVLDEITITNNRIVSANERKNQLEKFLENLNN